MSSPTPSSATSKGRLTDVSGLTVGHWTDLEHATGCTVVLCDEPFTAGMEVRGSAPGSRETELLHPLAAATWVNGIMLSGGSAFGLDAAGGAVRFLEEREQGIRFGRARIPLVPSAIVFDLGLVTHRVRPSAENGYAACQAASVDFARGTVGAGTGAVVGGLRGQTHAVKGGVGTASVRVHGGATVAALMVVNAVGSVVDPATGCAVAGPIIEKDGTHAFEDSTDIMINGPVRDRGFFRSTVIGVVATDAPLDKIGATRLAMAGQDGIALAVRPSHTVNDGDTVFALASGRHSSEVPLDALHAAALRATVGAVLDAIERATGLGGVPSAAEVMARAK